MGVADVVAELCSTLLADLSDERRTTFRLRTERWWADLCDGLATAYPDPEALAGRLLTQAAQAYAVREADLLELDERRLLEPDWLQQPRMFGYACYAERFADDLAGVERRLDYLQQLGVTYLHLMPLLQPRPGDNDGGYAVADYRSVRPDLGTVEDLRAWPGRCVNVGSVSCSTWSSTTSPASTSGHRPRDRAMRSIGPTSTSTPTGPSRMPSRRPCRGVP